MHACRQAMHKALDGETACMPASHWDSYTADATAQCLDSAIPMGWVLTPMCSADVGGSRQAYISPALFKASLYVVHTTVPACLITLNNEPILFHTYVQVLAPGLQPRARVDGHLCGPFPCTSCTGRIRPPLPAGLPGCAPRGTQVWEVWGKGGAGGGMNAVGSVHPPAASRRPSRMCKMWC